MPDHELHSGTQLDILESNFLKRIALNLDYLDLDYLRSLIGLLAKFTEIPVLCNILADSV